MKISNHCILLLLLISIFGCKSKQNTAAYPSPELPVVKVEEGNFTTFIQYPTALEGTRNIEVRPKIQGYIDRVFVDEGQEVKAGQPLFLLETNSLKQDAEAAKATVNASRLEVKRLKPLLEKKIISPIQLEIAQANLKQAVSNYKSILANIEYSNIKSPIDGVIGKIDLRKGNLVGPTSTVPLTSISNIENIYAYFSINEKDFLNLIMDSKDDNINEYIKNAGKVRLILANGSEYKHEGTIETISGNININTGAVRFRAIFPNDQKILRDGSSGTILIPHIYNNTLAIPLISTFEIQNKKLVYIIDTNDILKTKEVIPAGYTDKMLLIKSGLQKGELILAKGLNKVRPETKIKPIPTSTEDIINSY
ncbi:MAG: efflux RND transporter periplasmic adaptor subunit [Hyphomicrobiales bacterium]